MSDIERPARRARGSVETPAIETPVKKTGRFAWEPKEPESLSVADIVDALETALPEPEVVVAVRPARPVRHATAPPKPPVHDLSVYEPTDREQAPVFDYEADLKIDLNFLHIECQTHAELFMKYAKESARAKRAAAFAEEKVKTLRSQLVKEANEDPERFLGRGVKPVAANVEAYYRDHDEYKEIKAEWIEAVYYSDLISGTVYAMQARKTMLELETKLHGQQYYSTPEVENLSDAAKQFALLKEADVEMRIRLRLNEKGG